MRLFALVPILTLVFGAALLREQEGEAGGEQREQRGERARRTGADDVVPDTVDLVERGRYLTTRVAMCVQCHSPRDERGRLIEKRLFEGAVIPLEGPERFQGVQWAFQAPTIAGLPGYSDEDAVRLLMEGIAHSGVSPRPPMPPFRMTESDARSVVAFLRSLR